MESIGNGNAKMYDSTKTMIGGFVMLITAMGIGRFSYTAILPLMQSQTHLSAIESGYLAGSNNLGYLMAAFGAGFITWGSRRAYHLRVQLVLCIISTGLMGIASSFFLWMILRFLGGISSGLIFVLSSSLVLDALFSDNRVKWAGIFYGGVGTGIALTGLLTPVLSFFTWRGTWLGLSIVCIALIVPVWRFIRDDKTKPIAQNANSTSSSPENPSIFGWLLVAYGLEGLGYIVSATFLVAMVKQMPHISDFADYSWIIVGIAAIPSTVLWSWWASKAGYIHPLIIALILQACGVIMPVWLPNIFGVILGSVLFGGTFMGISMLAIAAARMVRPSSGNKAIALMTGFFGIGQIIGPIGAGKVMEVAHSYSLSLILATLVLVIAVAIMITGSVISNKKD
ncbi:MFS transporter [Paenibacillus sp. FSL A5-0031]|uniref:YbfB/YjiJ family MFS transporter n=1 Tax=Paenibacillus sp. FSL A5-0031 TaxID=1920420 RepID=UPI00096C1C66|nr:YbfB/YjiJ family MFS transporter [Paenibacillus sp. FSL A5-0031]OME75908.1 MFS transporter [Paenibacillus sp. FSL A5-0031]